MAADINQGKPGSVESLAADPEIGRLLRTVQSIRAENQRLLAGSLQLERRLARLLTDRLADDTSRRAALNLMEDAIEARNLAQREVEERRRMEEELRVGNRRKDEFLATLAHELRNPLAPIRNNLEILRLARDDNPAVQGVHEVLERQVNHMVRLVDDLLEVSRITRGQIALRKEHITVASVVQSALELSKAQIDAAGHHLKIDLPAQELILWADHVRISQVLANLLNNAAKYTEQGGQISLTARREGNVAVLSVADSGLGIPKQMLPVIFNLFAQVDRTLGRSQGGLGIGLTIVKSLVEAHGGTVEAHSAGADQGSEFVIRLQLVEAAHAPSRPAPRAKPQFPSNCGRILVVDDNRDAANSMAMLLNLSGVETTTANSGEAALDILHSYRPSLVLLDIGMPDLDGNEVARRIRSQPQFDDVMLVAMTGWGQEDDRRRSREAGFEYHLTKPVGLDDLKALLALIPSTIHKNHHSNAREMPA